MEGKARPLDLTVPRIKIPGLRGKPRRAKGKRKLLAFPSVGIEGLLACRPIINGKEMVMVVDSGASECLCTLGFYNTIPEPRPLLRPTRFNFTIANGESMPAVGVCDLSMILAGEKVTLRFFVSDCKDELALLGLTYLREVPCAIHAVKEMIIYDDGREPLSLSKERVAGSFLLRSTAHIKMTKHSYAVVRADIDCLYFNEAIEGKKVVCQSSEDLWDKSGVDSIDGYTTIKGGSAKIVLKNQCGYTVKIPKGRIIGEAFECAKASIVNEKFEREMNAKEMEEYAKTFTGEGNYGVPCVLASYLNDEEKDLFSSVGDDPPDGLEGEGEPEDKHGRHEEEMFAPIPVPIQGPEMEEGMPNYMKAMFDKEITGNIDLSIEFKAKARMAFIDMKSAFFDQSRPITQTDYAYHYIYTEDDKPVSFRPRRIPLGMKETVETEIDAMLKTGIIKESDSPWASPIVLVRKKDGTIRFCVDYRGLNEITRKDAYPLPRIEDYLDSFDGADTFCTLDLASGYWQVKMAEADKCKTAFTSHRGLFEFNVMPFGLCNAPATFQRMMDRLLGDLKHICLVYLDDIIVRGKGVDNCLENLRIVVERIKDKGLKLKPKKCNFFHKSVNFLGHIVSGEGVSTDPAKIAKVQNWPTPKTVGHVRSFLGLACYYQRFIKGYAHIARPLTNLLSKKNPFKWEDGEEKSFQDLKDALTSSPILGFPNSDGRYVLDTDASGVAIGAVLSQIQDDGKGGKTEKVIAYGSKTLNDAQVNYCTTKRELFAVFYFCCHKFRHYLAMKDFNVRTDHAALTWLQNFVGDDSLTNRWKTGLSQFGRGLTIEHRSGARHGNADGLSRAATRLCAFNQCDWCKAERLKRGRQRSVRPRTNEYNILCRSTGQFIEEKTSGLTGSPGTIPINLITVASDEQVDNSELINKCVWVCDSYSDEQIQGLQSDDLVVKRMVELLEIHQDSKPAHKLIEADAEDIKKMCMHWSEFTLRNGIVYKKPKSGDVLRLVAPRQLRDTIITHLHDFGHQGIIKTLEQIRRRFYWIRMKDDVIRWIKCCRTCAQHKTAPPRTKSPLTQERSGHRNERIAFDIIGPLTETKNGNRFILVIVDYFTKWAEAIALARHTAIIVAGELFEKWVTKFGVPVKYHSDQAPEFNSALMKQFFKLIDTCKTRTAPYRPQSNGLVERTNQTIEGILRCLTENKRSTWDEHLGTAMMAYRSTIHGSTGVSPNMMVFGNENFMPIDLMFRAPESWERENFTPGQNDCTCEYIAWLRKSIQDSYARARIISKVAAERQKRAHDVNTTIRSFKVGDWVLHWHKPTAMKTLSQGWRDPMVIKEKVSPVTYKVCKDEKDPGQNVHIDTLVKDIVRPWRANWLRKELPVPSSKTIRSETSLEPSQAWAEETQIPIETLVEPDPKDSEENLSTEEEPAIVPKKKKGKKRGRPRKSTDTESDDAPIPVVENEPEIIHPRVPGRPLRTRKAVVRYQGAFLCSVHEIRHIMDLPGQCPGTYSNCTKECNTPHTCTKECDVDAVSSS